MEGTCATTALFSPLVPSLISVAIIALHCRHFGGGFFALKGSIYLREFPGCQILFYAMSSGRSSPSSPLEDLHTYFLSDVAFDCFPVHFISFFMFIPYSGNNILHLSTKYSSFVPGYDRKGTGRATSHITCPFLRKK